MTSNIGCRMLTSSSILLRQSFKSTVHLRLNRIPIQLKRVHPSKLVSRSVAAADPDQPPNEGISPSAAPQTTWRDLLQQSLSTVLNIFWPLIYLHAITDAAVFCLHRLSHRITNEAALSLLSLGPDAFAGYNIWWLIPDPSIANFDTGYQIISALIFVFVFPIHTAIKAWSAAATIFLCQEKSIGSLTEFPLWKPVQALKKSAFILLSQLRPRVNEVWRRVFIVELLVAAIVLPLQIASLAVVTLPFTLPLIVELQASAVVAALENKEGKQALVRSRELIKPMKWRVAVPFVGLIVLQKVLEAGKGALLTKMPQRFYKELVEFPLVVVIGGAVATLLLSRIQDVYGFVVYQKSGRGYCHQDQVPDTGSEVRDKE